MKNLKTTALGVSQLLLAAAFAFFKIKNGLEFSDAEAAALGGFIISGLQGIASSDAKKGAT